MQKNDFEKDFFKLVNNAVSGKPIENVRKHRDIRLITTRARRNYFVSFFSENLSAIKVKKNANVYE